MVMANVIKIYINPKSTKESESGVGSTDRIDLAKLYQESKIGHGFWNEGSTKNAIAVSCEAVSGRW